MRPTAEPFCRESGLVCGQKIQVAQWGYLAYGSIDGLTGVIHTTVLILRCAFHGTHYKIIY